MVINRQHKKTASELMLWYKNYAVRTVLVILAEDYGMRFSTIMWSGEIFTLEQALATIPDYLLDLRCGLFGVIRFYGGPPGKTKWYNGTALTLICDAALFEIHTRDKTVNEKRAL